MVQDLCQAHKTEPHARSKKSYRGFNIGNTTHLLRFAEPFRVWFLNENVDDSHVALCIVVNLTENPLSFPVLAPFVTVPNQ